MSSRPSPVRIVPNSSAGTSLAWSARYRVTASVASSAQCRSSKITTIPLPPAFPAAHRSTWSTASAVTTTGSAGADQPAARQCGTSEASTVTYGANPASEGAARSRARSNSISAIGRSGPPIPSGKARPWTVPMPALAAASLRYSASLVFPTPASPTTTSAPPPA